MLSITLAMDLKAHKKLVKIEKNSFIFYKTRCYLLIINNGFLKFKLTNLEKVLKFFCYNLSLLITIDESCYKTF